MKMERLPIGQRIKDYMKSHGIKQTFVSEKTGIPNTRLNMALNGHRRLPYDEYELICGALNVGTDQFLEPRTKEVEE